MKLNYFIKTIPFLLTLLLTFFIFINNQKINTRLRILIWNTPSISLGTYLAISTGAGFILSYVLTNHYANIIRSKSYNSLKYKDKIENDEINYHRDINFKISSEKTLIERDPNDPSPTIDAQFRVISKQDRYNRNYKKNNGQYESANDCDDQYIEEPNLKETINYKSKISSDWNDDSFTRW